MKRLLRFLLCCCTGVLSSFAAEKTVYASKFGYDAKDATACLQKALDSGAEKVIVENMGTPWLVGPIQLRSNQHVLFQKGVVIQAKENAFPKKDDCLFTAMNVSNLVLEGEEGAMFKMNKAEYNDPARHSSGQWRMNISLRGSTNVTIRGLRISESGGDGIYLSRTWGAGGQDGCKNITIENCEIDNHHRQGISIISADGVVIRNCLIRDTAGTEPQAGIDFETNSRDEWQKNILVENCIFRENLGGGIDFASVSLAGVSWTVRNCHFDRNYQCAMMFSRMGEVPTPGKVRVENCRITSFVGCYPKTNYPVTTIPFFFSGTGSALYDIELENITVEGPTEKTKMKVSPVTILNTRLWQNKVGSVSFKNVNVKGYEDMPLVSNWDYTGELPLHSMSGVIRFNGKDVDVAEHIHEMKYDVATGKNFSDPPSFSLKDFRLPAKRPRGGVVRYAENHTALRGNFRMLLLGYKGMTAKMTFQLEKSIYERYPLYAVLLDANGGCKALGEVNDGLNTLSFTYPEDGVYMFNVISRGGNHLWLKETENLFWSIAHRNHPTGRISLAWTTPGSRMFFAVPPHTEEFKVSIGGDCQEAVSYQICNAKGKALAEAKNATILFAKSFTPKNKKPEIWSILFQEATEDVHVELNAPLSGVMAEKKEYLPDFVPAASK